MTDKLTDAEITVKALKEILELMLCDGDLQRTSTISHTIDLINRLQAENERLKKEINNFDEGKGFIFTIDGAEGYFPVEFVKEAIKTHLNIKTAKAEAYKEFADRVKEKTNWLFSSVSINKEIDNLLKELVGEDNG